MTSNLSSNERGPLWTPTAEVERLMRGCKGHDTIEVSAKILEGLCYDSLLWRAERVEQQTKRLLSGDGPAPETSSSDAEDAAKWRALRNCARMTAFGSAGLTPGTSTFETDYAHVSLNFWTGGKYDSPGEPYAREWLDGFVAKALRAAPSPLETTEIYTQEALDAAHARTRERLATLKVDEPSVNGKGD